MRKQILFLWFGDNKPAYADWNVNNFKVLNPGWDVNYIQYTKRQIYDNTDDPILRFAKGQSVKDGQLHFAALSDRYRMKYIDLYDGDVIAYFDLDCFPIAPLDDFFVSDTKNLDFLITDNLGACGYWVNSEKTISGHDVKFGVEDIWCLYKINNSKSAGRRYMRLRNFQQFVRSVDMDKPVGFYDQFIVNPDDAAQIRAIDENRRKFTECGLSVGDSICSRYFTPVEHYHRNERHTENTL